MRVLAVAIALLLAGACGSSTQAPAAKPRFRALVFTKTTGFRHDSIPNGVKAIERLGRERGFRVDVTENPARFNSRSLAAYDVVVFLSTTGTPIARRGEQRAFERYISRGGGYVGVHAASDTRGRWPWYERLVGARFKRHDPGVSKRAVQIEDRRTAATRGLPATWTRTDEWYEFRTNPRGRVHVLASLSESRPLAWCHAYDGGRSVYTAMGHTRGSFSEARFLAHLYGAISMAAGRARFDCAP
ncbi:MAG TPA: ThuA domain-containing protein [Solirubrobacter sp.]|nr:ThuA domain-containing protein [Solirubrobacter sp.]